MPCCRDRHMSNQREGRLRLSERVYLFVLPGRNFFGREESQEARRHQKTSNTFPAVSPSPGATAIQAPLQKSTFLNENKSFEEEKNRSLYIAKVHLVNSMFTVEMAFCTPTIEHFDILFYHCPAMSIYALNTEAWRHGLQFTGKADCAQHVNAQYWSQGCFRSQKPES